MTKKNNETRNSEIRSINNRTNNGFTGSVVTGWDVPDSVLTGSNVSDSYFTVSDISASDFVVADVIIMVLFFGFVCSPTCISKSIVSSTSIKNIKSFELSKWSELSVVLVISELNVVDKTITISVEGSNLIECWLWYVWWMFFAFVRVVIVWIERHKLFDGFHAVEFELNHSQTKFLEQHIH